VSLHVTHFGGGIVVDGSADTQRTDEVQTADSFDIGSRGALVVTSSPSDYLTLNDNAGAPAPWAKLWALLECAGFNFSKVVAIGEGDVGGAIQEYLMTSFDREGVASPYAWASGGAGLGAFWPGFPILPPMTQGAIVTGADFMGVFPLRFGFPGVLAVAGTIQPRVYFVNVGAREGVAPNVAPGLYVVVITPPSTIPTIHQIARFDALGTGSSGLFTVPITFSEGEGQANGGTHARQLFFRGIIAYNNHLFGWGYDAKDERIATITNITNANPASVTAAAHGYATGDVVLIKGVGGMTQVNGNYYTITVTGPNTFTLGVDSSAYGVYTANGLAVVGNGDGPGRVMFSNLGRPLKFGNDDQAIVGVDRAFTDSDAVVLGDAGEIIRGAITWAERLFFGTNKGLHFIAGYGRDSFITDGATPVMRSYNVIGPHAMIEGPDKWLYGVCEQGLWSLEEGGQPVPLFERLRDFKGRSNGFWDLIWTDVTRSATAYPGTTNQDLVWMAVDWERQQVVIGIPWCSIANGYGFGNDTVLIKYHVRTGGFTRQTFTGVQYTAAGYFRSVAQQAATRMLGTATAGKSTVQRYGYKATNNATPVLPSSLPATRLGPYAPFGPDGRGAPRRFYLTMSWEAMTPIAINSIGNSNPCSVQTVGAHGLTTGQTVELYGFLGMSELIGGYYTITVTAANTFTLNGVNSIPFSAYISGGFVGFPIVLQTVYQMDQSSVLVAGSVTTSKLALMRGAPKSPSEGDLWFDMSETDPNIGNATAGSITPALGGYLTKTRHDNQFVAITGATKANPCVVTAPGHNYVTGQRVSIRGVAGMTQLNNDATPGPYTKDYIATVIDADHFSIGVDSSTFGVYTSGGQAALAWALVPGGGMKGTRATIPIPLQRQSGTRLTMEFIALGVGMRYQLEGFGMNPGGGTPSA
jgi:hypothetical protein